MLRASILLALFGAVVALRKHLPGLHRQPKHSATPSKLPMLDSGGIELTDIGLPVEILGRKPEFFIFRDTVRDKNNARICCEGTPEERGDGKPKKIRSLHSFQLAMVIGPFPSRSFQGWEGVCFDTQSRSGRKFLPAHAPHWFQ